MGDTAFNVGDQFVDHEWDEVGESCQIIAIEFSNYRVLYEVRWANGDITYDRADYLRQLEKI